MAKPVTLPRWATDQTNNDAPSSGQMDTGWTPGQDGVSDYDNWAKYWAYKWIEWLDGRYDSTDALTGPLKVGSTISPSALTAGDHHDYSPTGLSTATTLRLDCGGTAANLTGIVGGVTDRILIIHAFNTAPPGLTLKHETGSTNSNRFKLAGSANYVIVDGASVILQYDGTDSRWRIIGKG